MLSFAKYDKTAWHKNINQGIWCDTDKASMTCSVFSKYNRIAAACLWKQKYFAHYLCTFILTGNYETPSDNFESVCVPLCGYSPLFPFSC